MLITDSITYNVNERGRKYRGVDRVFDTAALATMINSPKVQEKVKHGDMLGYFGHWPRLKFGMEFTEGGIDKESGKAIALPAAIRTLEVKAENDGTITHRAEFLDTEAGQIAEGLFKSKAGGFSSAIDAMPRTNPYIPRGFYGFDYVYEPNYSTNRGHKVVLDSISPELALMLDSVLEQAAIEQSEMTVLFDSLHAQHLDVLTVLERMSNERDELLERLARQSGVDGKVVLDSLILEDGRVAALRTLPADIEDWTRFKDLPLERLAALPQAAAAPTAESNYALRKYGFGG